MRHARTQVRSAVVAALEGAHLSSVLKVYSGRIHAFSDGHLPALAVYCRGESIRASATRATAGSGVRRERAIIVVVEGYAQVNSDLDDTLDVIGLEVEQALVPDRTLGGIAINFEPNGTELGVVEEAQRKTGLIRMTFTAIVHTLDNQLDQPAA